MDILCNMINFIILHKFSSFFFVIVSLEKSWKNEIGLRLKINNDKIFDNEEMLNEKENILVNCQ